MLTKVQSDNYHTSGYIHIICTLGDQQKSDIFFLKNECHNLSSRSNRSVSPSTY